MPKVNRRSIVFQIGSSQILLYTNLLTKEKNRNKKLKFFLWKADIPATSEGHPKSRGIYVMKVSIYPILVARPQGRKLGSYTMCLVSPNTKTFRDILRGSYGNGNGNGLLDMNSALK